MAAKFWRRLFARLPIARSTRAYAFGLQHVAPLPPGPVLDIGAGQGFGAAHLSRALAPRPVVSIDIELGCLKPAHQEAGPVPPRFVLASATDLPFAAESFALAAAVMTFHCLPQPQRVFREVYRTLRPGGVFLVADVDGHHWMARPFEVVEHWFISPLTRAYTPEDLTALARTAGFAETQVYRRPNKARGFMQWFVARKVAPAS